MTPKFMSLVLFSPFHPRISVSKGFSYLKYTYPLERRRNRDDQGLGRGGQEVVSNGCKASIWDHRRVPAMDDGDGHSNVHVLHATELYNLK